MLANYSTVAKVTANLEYCKLVVFPLCRAVPWGFSLSHGIFDAVDQPTQRV